ncbi:MAG: hypothetical protein JWL83_1463 [Actinomycetia bacterium]|nr:hypothetical protein [Actinomycetes bacterium]
MLAVMTDTTGATVTTEPIDRFLTAIETATIPTCDAWAADATLDATVPNWRFRAHGPDDIRDQYTGWFGNPARFEQLRREGLGDGELVEYLLTWEEHGVPYAAHHVHIIRVEDNAIASDTVMCGGRWPASLLAEMEAASHA